MMSFMNGGKFNALLEYMMMKTSYRISTMGRPDAWDTGMDHSTGRVVVLQENVPRSSECTASGI